ncbi:MAG: hypothetical protein ACLRZZ_28295 [Enterocloster sp.]
MNEKYVVAEKNQGKVFTVRSQHFDICGTEWSCWKDTVAGMLWMDLLW